MAAKKNIVAYMITHCDEFFETKEAAEAKMATFNGVIKHEIVPLTLVEALNAAVAICSRLSQS